MNRLSIAAFNDARALGEALGQHRAKHFAMRDLCLAGKRPVLRDLWHPREKSQIASQELAPLFLDVDPFLRAPAHEDYVTTSGRLLGTVKNDISTATDYQPPLRCLLTPQLQADLTQRMANNDVLLLASAATAEQHALSVRLLLKHSQGTVQSHVFKLGSAGYRQS